MGISGEFPNYTSGSAYNGTVSIVGGTPPYTVELVTEPVGTGSNGSLSPNNGATDGGAGLAIIGSVQQTAVVGVSFDSSLTVTGIGGQVIWSISTAAQGFNISQNGVLSFSPAVAGPVAVTVTASAVGGTPTTSRVFSINVVATEEEATPSVSGAVAAGYVGAPIFQCAIHGEGFTFTKPPNRTEWQSNASTGMPPNVTWSSCYVCGTPTAAGTYGWTTSFNISGTFDLIPASGSMTVLASPSFTVLNPCDRDVNQFSIRMEQGAAPLLSVTGRRETPFGSGFIRALNGHAAGLRYWEVRVDAMPTTYENDAGSWLSAGIDRSRYGLVTYDANGNPTLQQTFPGGGIGSDNTSSMYGYGARRVFGQTAYNAVVGGRNLAGSSAPLVVVGSILRFAHDATNGRLWVGIAGSGWIGGGDPAAGTSPTLSGLVAETPQRHAEWKPFVFATGGAALTCNFGSQAWEGGGPPSGFTGISFAKVPEFSRMVLDSDTMDTRGVTGFLRGVFVMSQDGGGGIIFSPERYASGVRPREGADDAGRLPTVRGGIPKSTGKWHVELIGYSFGDSAAIGLAPFDWVQSVGGGPGYTSDSFGVFPRGTGSLTADVVLGGSVVATPATGGIYTLAVDLDANPQTVRVVRNGEIVGTYNLPNTGKAWVPVLCYAGLGGARINPATLRYPQSGFQDWTA